MKGTETKEITVYLQREEEKENQERKGWCEKKKKRKKNTVGERNEEGLFCVRRQDQMEKEDAEIDMERI